MKSRKWIGILMTLTLCVSVFFTPVTAHAATDKDTTLPKLVAELVGETVKIQASDEGSGLEAVYIDSRRVATLVNGAATVALKDYHGNGKEVTVYAVDYAGNKSDTVKFQNPLYQAPAPLPPASTPTPAPSSSSSNSAAPPASSSSSQAPAASSSSSSSPNSQSGSSSSSQGQSTDSNDSDSQSSSPVTDSAIPSSGDGFTPDGAGEVLDTATEDSKDFYTITTPDGYVYYLVIDHSRDSDNVYFLNAVTEADLLGLTDSATVPGQSAIPDASDTPVPAEPEPDDTSAPQDTDNDGNGGFGTIIFVLLIVAAVGGAGWYLKIYRPKQQATMDEEDEFGGEGEEWDEVDTLTDDYDYDAEQAHQSDNGAEFENEEADILEQ